MIIHKRRQFQSVPDGAELCARCELLIFMRREDVPAGLNWARHEAVGRYCAECAKEVKHAKTN